MIDAHEPSAPQGGSPDPAPLSLDNPHDRELPPSRLPDKAQWVLVTLFIALVVASGLFSLLEHWRRATFALGLAMLWLAICRFACDSRILGVFSVRSRRFDAAFSVATGALLVWLAVSVDSLGS